MCITPETASSIEARNGHGERQPLISRARIEEIKVLYALNIERTCRDAQGNFRIPTFGSEHEEADFYHAIVMMDRAHFRIEDDD